ncbi:uncharacterized protein PgNI_04434 [Pyricularia grisea]|uniref:Uncharacterized protein n=1 Tax=Pyricularia grisea TaxID=148305 RepID=A0A6P8BEG3_PYRGI|nr:uncharacterized protein PgNI_04434 [Pyricularia grisea]TLD14180.1 hypothetical protein PgNI_04434 [Pyricularia grisea]
MPSKRQSTGSTSSPKRARASSPGSASNVTPSFTAQEATTTTTSTSAPQLGAAEKLAIAQILDRWSDVSCSKNLDKEYQGSLEESKKPFEYLCQCKSPFKSLQDDGDDDDDGDEANDNEQQADENATPPQGDGVLQTLPKYKNVACDHRKNGICGKPAAEHPDHPWAVMRAAIRKTNSTYTHLDVRDPDNLGMDTFKDHLGYGWVQVFQNFVLDYQVARLRRNWREQWVVCTVIGRISLQVSDSPIVMIDDAEGLEELFLLIASLFLDMLATLEDAGQLDPSTTEIKDLGPVMACFIISAQQLRSFSIMEKPMGKSRPQSFDGHLIDDYIVAYAQRHNITLGMPEPYRTRAAEQTAGASPDMLPKPAGEEGGADSRKYWAFEERLKKYEDQYRGTWAKDSKQQGIIGGDSLDLTSWKPADRKKKASGQKDPLPKDVIKALKDGMIVGLV